MAPSVLLAFCGLLTKRSSAATRSRFASVLDIEPESSTIASILVTGVQLPPAPLPANVVMVLPPSDAPTLPEAPDAPATTTAAIAATPTTQPNLSRAQLRWRSSRWRALQRPILPARMVDLFGGERDMRTPNARPAVP